MSNRTLLLVDGTMALYRSFFAIPGLATRAGTPTNALFGFIRTLRDLRRQHEPTHMAVVLDGGLPAERMRLLPEYKAQRPPMPTALRAQIEPTREYMTLAGIPCIRREGEEADDVMASLSEWAAHRDAAVLCASADKDLYQLVSDRVRMVPIAGKVGTFGPTEVHAKTGVPPVLIPAWLALIGDTSDNIPGVPGIGPKTAAKLLTQYGSLEVLRAALGDMPESRIRSALLEHWGAVERNLGLVTLNRGIDVVTDWPAIEPHAEDRHGLADFFVRHEFESLAREIREPVLFE